MALHSCGFFSFLGTALLSSFVLRAFKKHTGSKVTASFLSMALLKTVGTQWSFNCLIPMIDQSNFVPNLCSPWERLSKLLCKNNPVTNVDINQSVIFVSQLSILIGWPEIYLVFFKECFWQSLRKPLLRVKRVTSIKVTMVYNTLLLNVQTQKSERVVIE